MASHFLFALLIPTLHEQTSKGDVCLYRRSIERVPLNSLAYVHVEKFLDIYSDISPLPLSKQSYIAGIATPVWNAGGAKSR